MLKRINKELALYTVMCILIGVACTMLYVLAECAVIGHKSAVYLDSFNRVEHTGMLSVVEKNEEVAPWMTRDERIICLGLQADEDARETGKNVRIDVDSAGARWIHVYDANQDIYDVVF